MKDIRGSVFGMMGFYFIMSACFIGGIPTYTEELTALLSLIYAPMLLPVLICLIGIRGEMSLSKLKVIKILAKLSLVYEVIILPVLLNNYGMLGILLFLGTFVVDFSSILMLISILRRAGREYKEYSSQTQL